MMKVKGSALVSMPMFITSNFGEAKLQEWIDSLNPLVANTFRGSILASSWYPLKEYLEMPTQKCCDMFYHGSEKGAWDMGRFSAEFALKGIYKLFVKVGSPQFIISRGARILPSYYEPSTLETNQTGDNTVDVMITEFPEISKIIENRIAGWMQAALELHGCKNVRINTGQSMLSGADKTVYSISWS